MNIEIYFLVNLLPSSRVHFINWILKIACCIILSHTEFSSTVRSTFVRVVGIPNNHFFQILKKTCFHTFEFILINYQTYCHHRPSHNHLYRHCQKNQIHLLHPLLMDCFGTLRRNRVLQYTSIQISSKSIFGSNIRFYICTAQILVGTPELMDGSSTISVIAHLIPINIAYSGLYCRCVLSVHLELLFLLFQPS